MIFYTVGTQLPFDRLTKQIDILAQTLEVEIIGQIGKSSYVPKNFNHFENLMPNEYQLYFNRADLVISHAGMGTILRCISSGKRLIVCPRLAEFGEHRNNHQLDTVSKLAKHECLIVQTDLTNLLENINFSLENKIVKQTPASKYASTSMIEGLKELIRK